MGRGPQDAFEEAAETVGFRAEEDGQADVAGQDGEDRQDDEGDGHGPRGFVDVPTGAGLEPLLAVEGQVDEAEHVKRRQDGAQEAQRIEDVVAPGVGARQDGVLGEKSRQERNARDGQGADEEDGEGHRQVFPQAAHPAQVLPAAQGVDDAPRREEEQALEESVGDQVEHARRVGPDAAAQEHVSDLGDGRIGQDALDVVLHESDRGGEDGRHAPDPGDDGRGRERRPRRGRSAGRPCRRRP